MFKHVLFDLDGTLTDSKTGIIRSVRYALEKMGEPTEGRLATHIVVGPPMLDTYRDVYGFSDEKARLLYSYFQERYSTIGKFENGAFPGVTDMLWTLKQHGIHCYVATSKPKVHAEAICERYGIAPYVDSISGPIIGSDETKADSMRKILATIPPEELASAVMVGDKKYDIIGARETGLPSILVGYGYSTLEERQAFPPDYFVTTVQGLTDLLLRS